MYEVAIIRQKETVELIDVKKISWDQGRRRYWKPFFFNGIQLSMICSRIIC